MGGVTGEPTSRSRAPGRLARRPPVRVGAIVAVALAAAFVVRLFVHGGGASSPTTVPKRAGAVPASPAVLGALARSSGSPIYWAGPRAGEAPTSAPIDPGGGGVAFYARTRPTNVYVAYPGTDVQIEVYDRSAGRAHRLVAAGRIVPVG